MKKFKSVDEIYQVYNEIGMRQLVSPVRLVDVVIGKTKDKKAISDALTAIGYSKR